MDTRRHLVFCLIALSCFYPLRGWAEEQPAVPSPADSMAPQPAAPAPGGSVAPQPEAPSPGGSVAEAQPEAPSPGDSAAEAQPAVEAHGDSVDTVIQPFPPVPFRVGERLVFSVEYGFVTAGEATMSVASLDTIQGHPAYRIETVATTNEIFSTLYKVEDKVVSHMDAYGLYSRHFKKRLREGNYKKDMEVQFDQEGKFARYVEGDSLTIVPGTQDVLSAFFSLRSEDLRVGEVYSIPCHDNQKNYPLEVKVLRREKIAVPAGKFECYVVEPKLKSGGLTKKEAKMYIWLTSDERKMPVLMETRMKIGSIAAKLVDYSSGDGGNEGRD